MRKSTALYLFGLFISAIFFHVGDDDLAIMAYTAFLSSMILIAIEDKK